MYPNCSDYIHEKLPELRAIAEDEDDLHAYPFVDLVKKISNHNPNIIDPETITYLVHFLDGQYASFLLQPFRELLPRRPHLFDPHHKKIGDFLIKSSQSGIFYNLIQDLAYVPKLAKFYTNILWKKFNDNPSSQLASEILYGLRNIANKYVEPILVYKPQLQSIKLDRHKDVVMSILDIIEGRTLETVANDVQDIKEDIVNIDERITENEHKIDYLDNDLQETKKDVKEVKEDVQSFGQRLKDVEYDVKNLDDRVEEFKHMTISHAPVWSRHVSELMNEKIDNDWRLLAMRLNFTNDDIRNWATQPDPCLSMLDEWFATHKTREATYAILNNLKDMNRIDAAAIVQSALDSLKDTVKDDDEGEFQLPEVFLSYQWAHQQEVKILFQHLEMAGFKACMDIGQMGGGDKLFSKIDDGIRSAKVIIS